MAVANSDIQQVANAAYAVGLRGDSLVTAIAIAGAESGYELGAHGDVSIGGSYGPWQIYIPAHPEYSPEWLTESYLNNAQAMYQISGGGSNWMPWTTYFEGTYQKHMAEAEQAAASATGDTSGGSTGGTAYVQRPDMFTDPFGTNLDALLAEFGGRVWINSGFRSREEQIALWEGSDKSGVMVGEPSDDWDEFGWARSGSFHQRGMAADLGWDDSVSDSEFTAALDRHDLWRPMDYEPWHVEPKGSRDGTYVRMEPGQTTSGGIKGFKGFDIPGTGALDAVSDVAKKLLWFSKPNNILRLGQGFAGITLILGGAFLMAGTAKSVREAASMAANVTPVGRGINTAAAAVKGKVA